MRRQGISAGAGTLKVSLYNNDQQHDVNDFRNKRIRVDYNGATRWGGRIDDPKEKPHPNDIRIITIEALGILAEIGGNVPTAISESGDTLVTDAIEEVTGIAITPASTEVVTGLNIAANTSKLAALRSIQNSSGTRLYEKADGTLGLASEGITRTRDDFRYSGTPRFHSARPIPLEPSSTRWSSTGRSTATPIALVSTARYCTKALLPLRSRRRRG